MLMRILLLSIHDDGNDNDDEDNPDEGDDDFCTYQDYVDENLAAFQAQITQLQGEYLPQLW